MIETHCQTSFSHVLIFCKIIDNSSTFLPPLHQYTYSKCICFPLSPTRAGPHSFSDWMKIVKLFRLFCCGPWPIYPQHDKTSSVSLESRCSSSLVDQSLATFSQQLLYWNRFIPLCFPCMKGCVGCLSWKLEPSLYECNLSFIESTLSPLSKFSAILEAQPSFPPILAPFDRE